VAARTAENGASSVEDTMRALPRNGGVGALLLLAVLGLARTALPAEPPAGSPVLKAMEQEMARAVEGLRAKADQPPYFLMYSVTDLQDTSIAATCGALEYSSSDRARLLDVAVRVGDYALDNTHRLQGDRFSYYTSYSPARAVAIEDDLDSLRAALWLETDRKYKAALESLTQVKANVAVKVKEEDTSADFSRDEPQRFIGPPAQVRIDVKGWEKRLKAASAVFNATPEIYRSSVSLRAEAVTKYLVTSEGTVLQHSSVQLRVGIYAETKAEDGMELYRYESFEARTPEKLPDDAAVRAAIEHIVADLKALRAAPVIEPYTGPAILDGRASGVFFHEVFGHRIEGHRQKDEQEGQTYTKKVNEQVLPTFISVYDDPTMERFGTKDLLGSYRYDDEGVKAQRVVVVDKGILKSFLMSRSPIASFSKSNGHGRSYPGFRAVGRQGNLIVEASETVPEGKLREMLIEECKKQGKPFGLIFKDISGGFTFTGRGIPQVYQVTPLVVYRVYTDGRPDELVRGADLIGTPLVSFSKILAASDRVEVFNGYCGAESGPIPVSLSAPSILTGQIEIQKKEKSADRPPLLPPPGKGDRP
jgi:TldD protein